MGYEVSIKAAKDRLSELVRDAEAGQTSIITRNGKPVADIVPHRPKRGGLNRAALERWKAERGITHLAGPYDGDFDAPFDEDFLIKPMP
jgi:prevent-host-death family protein